MLHLRMTTHAVGVTTKQSVGIEVQYEDIKAEQKAENKSEGTP